MAVVKYGNGFEITDYTPIDVRQVLTKAEMATIVGDDESSVTPGDFAMPEVYFAFCIDDGCFYKFDYNATPDPETGKFTKLELGGSTPAADSGPESERPDADDANPGDKWYDPTTGETTVVVVDSEGNNQWVPLTPAAGEMMFDATNGKILYFDGNQWKEVGGLSDTAVGTTAPSNPNPGDKWLDESQNPPVLKEYGEDGQWHNVTAKAGELMYDATNDVVMYFDGTEWKPIGGGVEHVSTLPASADEGEIIFDESTGQYKVYEDGVWLTLAKTWEGTESEYTTLGGNTWSTAHPDVIMFIK